MKSLLGQFYNRIKGSQEDIASESLVYILKQSIESRKVINQIVKYNTDLNFSDLSFQTQNVGKELERPDISGKDKNGNEVLLIEAKFWASLTHNQPNGYLKRLNNNTVLIFLVPTLRTRTVFEEVKKRILEEYNGNDLDIKDDNLKVFIKSTQQHIFIKSWHEVLNAIKAKIEQTNDINLISDLNQIIGFCDSIDRNSFQPITDKDLSPKIPKNINSYYEIVDKVVDDLKNRITISTKGLQKTAQRYGYHRYFKTKELGMNFALKLDLWEKCADTPFWLAISQIKDNDWIITEQLRKSLESLSIKENLTLIQFSNGKGYFLSIRPTLYETEDIVIRNITNKIEKIIEEVTNANTVYKQ